jgi:predicted AAA+ superfamily ATPase
MFARKTEKTVREALARHAAGALLGPRQVGKTTLAQRIGASLGALYLDLEDPERPGRG